MACFARQISNFHIVIDRDLSIEDEQETTHRLEGRVVLGGRESAFKIDAEDFYDGGTLQSAIGAAVGAEARIMCKPHELRDAVSWLNYHGGRWQPPVRQRRTTRFGWNTAGDAYHFPSGKITSEGFVPVTDRDEVRVDLGVDQWSCHLNLLDPGGEPPIHDLHRHIVSDLLTLQVPQVTYSLLGATALAVLQRFAPGDGKFVLWVLGLTGASKSFTARRFQHFFGGFPEEGISNWSSTPNSIEQRGYYFCNALYLVDDYKADICRRDHVLRLVQAYADLTSRERLRSDSTAATSRRIRGLLAVTGEDLVKHTASGLARTITVTAEDRLDRREQGRRCLAMQDH